MFGKKIRIFDEEIDEREWKRRLASDEGLFKRIETRVKFKGPTLVGERGEERIIGDFMATENIIFSREATRFQLKLHTDLLDQDPERANEYLLTVTGAIDVWKEDIKLLRNLLTLLRQEEEIFEDEEAKIKAVEDIKNRLPEVIERHFPEAFHTIKEHLINMDRFFADIKYAEERMKELETKISDYLESLKTKKYLGFLLE